MVDKETIEKAIQDYEDALHNLQSWMSLLKGEEIKVKTKLLTEVPYVDEYIYCDVVDFDIEGWLVTVRYFLRGQGWEERILLFNELIENGEW